MNNKSVFVTIDSDWVHDEILELTIKWFLDNDIAITIFMTHASEVAYAYLTHPLVEIGIHPFFKHIDDSKNTVELMKYIYPTAIGSRSHRNIAGKNCINALKQYGYIYDVSKLLFGLPNVEITPLYNGMVEAPYIWEDGAHLEMNLPISEKVISDNISFWGRNKGLNILNIHPIVFYINPTQMKQINNIHERCDDLTTIHPDILKPEIVDGFGMSSFIKKMFLDMKSDGFSFYLLKDIMLEAYDANK